MLVQGNNRGGSTYSHFSENAGIDSVEERPFLKGRVKGLIEIGLQSW
jgi:hypothetical protein